MHPNSIIGLAFVLSVDYLRKNPNCQPKGMTDAYLCRFEERHPLLMNIDADSHSTKRICPAKHFYPFMSMGNPTYIPSDIPRCFFDFLVELASNMHVHAFEALRNPNQTTTKNGARFIVAISFGLCLSIA